MYLNVFKTYTVGQFCCPFKSIMRKLAESTISWGYLLTSTTGVLADIWNPRYYNQCLMSTVNNKHKQNSTSGTQKSEEADLSSSVLFNRVAFSINVFPHEASIIAISRVTRLNIWSSKTAAWMPHIES